MDLLEWEACYLEILRDFGFPRRWDEVAAEVLVEHLRDSQLASEDDVKRIILGKDVLVVADSDVEVEETYLSQGTIIAADGATTKLRELGIVPEIVVTDLDGDVEDQLEANAKGAICVIHAHGDNIDAIREWTKRFNGKVAGSTQSMPFGPLHNYGGFTDGDRAALLAQHFHARAITLVGFDFDRPKAKPGKDPRMKLRKLGWAERIIKENVKGVKWVP